MSKQLALLDTLLGAAELTGNRTIASRIRQDLFKISHSQEEDGYQRLARAALEPRHLHSKAA
jgi:hypothetical protein